MPGGTDQGAVVFWASVATLVAFVGSIIEFVFRPIRTWRASRMTRRMKLAETAEARLILIQSSSEEALRIARRIENVLVTADPTALRPDPELGLIDTVHTHSKMLARLQPNGGDTGDTGDLILRMARKLGVEDPPTEGAGSGTR